MDSMVIEGPTRLAGTVRAGGAKNAALPIMAACLLTSQECRIDRVPELADAEMMLFLLDQLGALTTPTDTGVSIVIDDESRVVAHYDIVRKMRASICVMGPLLARRKKAVISKPGGCVIGVRPIDLHLKGLKALGAKITEEQGYVILEADRLKGAEIFLGGRHGSSVLGTANVLCAATLAQGRTVIECAACEPEIADLGVFLTKMGAKITGIGSPRLVIEGVEELHGASHELIPDRVEAGTILIAAVLAGDGVTIENCRSDHLGALIDIMRNAGVDIETNGTVCRVPRAERFQSSELTTLPYPGFPTDLQAQMMTLLATADGLSIVTEKIYPDRFMHVPELNRLGADIVKEGATAIVRGPRRLQGAEVMASDLRASAALVLAGLVAEGQTTVNRVYHLDRGYEHFENKLKQLGATVYRISK